MTVTSLSFEMIPSENVQGKMPVSRKRDRPSTAHEAIALQSITLDEISTADCEMFADLQTSAGNLDNAPEIDRSGQILLDQRFLSFCV